MESFLKQLLLGNLTFFFFLLSGWGVSYGGRREASFLHRLVAPTDGRARGPPWEATAGEAVARCADTRMHTIHKKIMTFA